MDSYSGFFASLLARGVNELTDVFSLLIGSLPLLNFESLNGKIIGVGSKDHLALSGNNCCEETNLTAELVETADGAAATGAPGLASPRCATSNLIQLKKLLQRPAPAATCPEPEFPRLSPSEIRKTIETLIPESSSWIAPRSNGRKALDFLVMSYSTGFPALPPAASKHCAEGVRLIVGALADPVSAGLKPGRAKVLARTLAEAYTGCQAVQARTVDMLQGEVRGLTSQSLPAQLRVLAEEFREAALDRMVCHFHPGAPTAGDGTPHMQLPHLANKYRRHLGSSIGVSGSRMEAALSDRNASGPLPSPKEAAVARFWQEFDAEELCRAIVADVNQASEDAERRIDARLLLDWAGSHSELGYRVFYDEAMHAHYGDMQPSADQEAMRQPFIYDDFACELLLSALDA
jgi:hypothetical protein